MRTLLFAGALSIALAACGQGAPPAPSETPSATEFEPGISVSGAWAAATPGAARVAAGYLSIMNGGPDEDRLLSAASPRAGRVEIHEMRMDGAMMQMRAVEGGLAVPVGAVTELAPGGMHIMFMDITGPFAEGETVPLTLTFEKAGAVEVSLPVQARIAGEAHGGH